MSDQENTSPTFKGQLSEIEPESSATHFGYFIILSGPDAGMVVTLQEGTSTVGRSEESEIYVRDRQISRSHLEVVVEPGNVEVRDLKSMNGTFINGEKLAKKTLKDGDEIAIGLTTIRFSCTNPLGAPAGLHPHPYFESRVSEEIDRAGHYRRPVTVAMIRPKIGKEPLEDFVAFLKKHVRTMDILASYGKNDIEILLPETNNRDAVQIIQAMLEEAPKKIKVDAGVATYPEDATTKDELIEASRKALRSSSLTGKKGAKEDSIDGLMGSQAIVQSERMKEIYATAAKIAGSHISVLIQGETGAGKEVVAEHIHRNSPRRNKAWVILNCAAFPEQLLESELFGHERGAFTGADSRKIGLLETANGGTVFLDEVGEMPLKTQVKFLRVLQNNQFRRVGGTEEINVDVRVISATNKQMKEMTESGEFREDLYYRLNGILLEVPPLRERSEEIPYLAQYFLKIYAHEYGKPELSLPPESIEVLQRHSWPGNVRELKNAMERAVVITEGPSVFPTDLNLREARGGQPRKLDPFEGEDITISGDMKEVVQDYEKSIIIAALKKTNWNQTKAADLLKIPRRTLVSKIKKYDISRD